MNSFNQNLMGRTVLLKPTFHGGSVEERKFLCQSGFGCMPFTHGTTVLGLLLVNSAQMTIDVDNIEGLWEPEPALATAPPTTAAEEAEADTAGAAEAPSWEPPARPSQAAPPAPPPAAPEEEEDEAEEAPEEEEEEAEPEEKKEDEGTGRGRRRRRK